MLRCYAFLQVRWLRGTAHRCSPTAAWPWSPGFSTSVSLDSRSLGTIGCLAAQPGGTWGCCASIHQQDQAGADIGWTPWNTPFGWSFSTWQRWFSTCKRLFSGVTPVFVSHDKPALCNQSWKLDTANTHRFTQDKHDRWRNFPTNEPNNLNLNPPTHSEEPDDLGNGVRHLGLLRNLRQHLSGEQHLATRGAAAQSYEAEPAEMRGSCGKWRVCFVLRNLKGTCMYIGSNGYLRVI